MNKSFVSTTRSDFIRFYRSMLAQNAVMRLHVVRLSVSLWRSGTVVK